MTLLQITALAKIHRMKNLQGKKTTNERWFEVIKKNLRVSSVEVVVVVMVTLPVSGPAWCPIPGPGGIWIPSGPQSPVLPGGGDLVTLHSN